LTLLAEQDRVEGSKSGYTTVRKKSTRGSEGVSSFMYFVVAGHQLRQTSILAT
jgi:hypothetical protein